MTLIRYIFAILFHPTELQQEAAREQELSAALDSIDKELVR